ncbi:MAG: hypothetical protein HY302_16320 [Opitutae bacterium]|nr:hypothetical protein [Opitutae bacterium]
MKLSADSLRHWANVAATGVYFGVLQWGAFFQLQSYLASTAVVYLLATTVWLAGSFAGLLLPMRAGEGWWIAAAASGYYGLRAVAVAHPYDFGLLPVLLAFVALMGGYAGRFFRARQEAAGGAKWLFLVENTGFVAGLVATVAGLYWLGEGFLAVAPGALAAVCLATAGAGRFRN